jgi:hypothetical protein
MATELTVPPGVTLTFERLASDICSKAKLDYDDTALQAHELVTHLRERWLEGIEGGLTTDAAEKRALRLFGSAAEVARSLRQPWLWRVLLQERTRAERYLLFLAADGLYSWLAVLETYYREYLMGKPLHTDQMMLPADWMFFVYGLGSFGVGIAAVGVVALMSWKPDFKTRWLNTLLVARKILGIIPFSAGIVLIVAPSYFLERAIRYRMDGLVYKEYCAAHLLSVLLGWLAAACILVEVFDLPGRVRRRRPRPIGFAS